MTVLPTPLTSTISFSRKISVRPYESAEASMFMQFEIDPDNPEVTLASAKHAFFQAKALVFEELGLEFSIEDGGVIRELLTKNFGAVTEVTNSPAAVAPAATQSAPESVSHAAPAPAGGANPPYSADTMDKNEKAANKTWALARIASNPDEFWDNRENKRNPKAPDYKGKTNNIAVWL
jgi:hypothetical protein